MKALSPEILCGIEKLPLFHELDSGQLHLIATNAREVTVNKGEMLFQRGDESRGFFLLLSGQIKLAFPSTQGNEKVVAIIGAGQSFGEAAMFLNQPYPVRAEALIKSDVIVIRSSVIFQLLAQDKDFARKLLVGLSMRLHQLLQDVELYSQRSSAQRVIGYLLQLCPTAGSCDVPITVDLPATKQVIASRLNLTPETLSRILHDLAENGLIEMQGRRIYIPNPEPLRCYDL